MKPASCRHRQAVSILANSTNDLQKLSELIGDVYDAALDQSLWEEVIARATDFIGGAGATLFSKDATPQSGNLRYQLGKLHYAVGVDPHYQRLYFDKYAAFDPVATGHFLVELDQPFAL